MIILNLVVALLVQSPTAHAGDTVDAERAELRELASWGECSASRTANLVKRIGLDEESAFLSITSGCFGRMIKNSEFNLKSWLLADWARSRNLQIRLLKEFEEKMLIANKAISEGRPHFSEEDGYRLGVHSGLLKAIALNGCDAKPKKREVCSELKRSERLSKELLVTMEKSQNLHKEAYADNLISKSCGLLREQAYQEKIIQEERDGAKYSGVVDAGRMHEAGRALASVNKKLAPYEQAYKKATRRKLTYDLCRAR